MLGFTDWVPNKKVQNNIGWSMIIIISISIFINLAIILYNGSRSLSLIYKKYKALYHYNIKMREKEIADRIEKEKRKHKEKEARIYKELTFGHIEMVSLP